MDHIKGLFYWCTPNKVHNSAESDTAWCSDGGGEAGGLVITNEDPRMAAQAKCSHEEGWVSCVRRSVVVGWACHFFTPYSIELVLTCQALLSSTGATGGVVLLEVSCELPSRKMHKAESRGAYIPTEIETLC